MPPPGISRCTVISSPPAYANKLFLSKVLTRHRTAERALPESRPEVSSGKVIRHRFNRGDSQQANTALCQIAIVHPHHNGWTREYAENKQSDGKPEEETNF